MHDELRPVLVYGTQLGKIRNLYHMFVHVFFFFFSSRRRHTRFDCDWSSDVCSSDLGFLKCAARPRILLSREPGVSHAHMQLDGVRIEPQAVSQGLDRFVVLGFVVELMRAFVVVVGAQERFRHRTGLPGRLCYDTTPRTVTQATDAEYLPRRCPPC